MKQYRLKKEALPFFLEKHATAIYPLDTWKTELSVDANALEEVKEPVIYYGQVNPKSPISSWLGGWDENGTHLHFTIVFPSMQFQEHDRFTNGRMIREIMDKINSSIQYHYNSFVTKK